MAKPWGRYEIDFIDHPKFRALHANAFVLWWEVKNYCDKFHTDGRFPRDLVNTFRHNSQKATTQLMTSCGVKPNGEAYAPLWEPQDIGGVAYLTMHDYLDHNDCRDKVMDRIERAEAERQKKAAAQKAYRERQKAERDAERSENVPGTFPPTNAERSSPVPETFPHKQKHQHQHLHNEQIQERETRARATVFDGALPRDHVPHVFCDPTFSICVAPQVHAKLLNAISRRFGGDRAAAHEALKAWYATVAAALPADTVMGDGFKFWQPRFDAEFATKDAPVSLAAHEAKVRADADAVLKLIQQDDAKKAATR